MIINIQPGRNLGFSETYRDNTGTLRDRTRWMRCVTVDHRNGFVMGPNLHTCGMEKVHIALVHTSVAPFEVN